MLEEEIEGLMSTPNAVLKTRLIEARPEACYQHAYSPEFPGTRNSLIGTMYNWRRQFIGRWALEFKHCVLVIAIRREHQLEKNLEAFFTMWSDEGQFLAKSLNVKWLLSACDTFIDHCSDQTERATAIASAMLVKTIKLYETEERFRLKRVGTADWPTYRLEELFDGLNTFNIGHGDVVINLKRRVKDFVTRGTPTALILDELFDRVCKFNTVFCRWRAEHTDNSTKW